MRERLVKYKHVQNKAIYVKTWFLVKKDDWLKKNDKIFETNKF